MVMTDPKVEKLFAFARCGRELLSPERSPDERCSMPTERFSPACRYHETEAEHDAAVMGRVAFRMGVQRGWVIEEGDWDNFYPERNDWLEKPRQSKKRVPRKSDTR